METPDYLLIGTVCQDMVDTGMLIGGTVAYSGLTARNLGCKTAAITSFAEDFAFLPILDGIEVVRQTSPVTTTYQNVYVGGRRHQYVRAVASPIARSLVPPAWRQAGIVHIGPLVQEVEPDIVDLFPEALIGITPQGWMRRWDEAGRVWPARWYPPENLLRRTRVLVLSEEDVGGDLSIVDEYARQIEILVLTSGWKGSSVYWQGQVTFLPAPAVQEVDPTGAGDVFAAAYFVRLQETDDPIGAARFANCVASVSVERRGIDGIPTEEEMNRCRTGWRTPRACDG